MSYIAFLRYFGSRIQMKHQSLDFKLLMISNVQNGMKYHNIAVKYTISIGGISNMKHYVFLGSIKRK